MITKDQKPKGGSRIGRIKRFQSYRWSQEMCQKVKPLHKLNNWRCLLMVGEDYFLIIASIVISVWSWNFFPIPIALVIYLLAITVIGARQRGLRVILHSSSHRSAAKNKRLNYLLGTVASGWLTLESMGGYNPSHNSVTKGHHPNLGTLQDPDHQAVVSQGLYESERGGTQVITHLLTLPLQTLKYLRFLLTNRMFSAEETMRERFFRAIYLVSIIALLLHFGWGDVFVFYWLVPLFSTAIWVGLFIQLAEHYPLIEKAPEPNEIYVSRNRNFNPVLNLFFNAHHEGYHLVHHLFPGIPFWNIKEAHELLLEDPIYASVNEDISFQGLINSLTS